MFSIQNTIDLRVVNLSAKFVFDLLKSWILFWVLDLVLGLVSLALDFAIVDFDFGCWILFIGSCGSHDVNRVRPDRANPVTRPYQLLP